jgi:hypothetical protein
LTIRVGDGSVDVVPVGRNVVGRIPDDRLRDGLVEWLESSHAGETPKGRTSCKRAQ